MNLWNNLRSSARIFLHEPGFAALTILTLALGVGAKSMEGGRIRPRGFRQGTAKVRIVGAEEAVDPVERAEKSMRSVVALRRMAKQHCDLAPIDRMRASDAEPANRKFRQLIARHQLDCRARMTPRECLNRRDEAD